MLIANKHLRRFLQIKQLQLKREKFCCRLTATQKGKGEKNTFAIVKEVTWNQCREKCFTRFSTDTKMKEETSKLTESAYKIEMEG